MFNSDTDGNKSVFTNSAVMFANTIALIVTILAAPEIVARISDPLDALLLRQHGYTMTGEILSFLLKCSIYPALFFLLRMSLVTAFVTGAIAFAARYVT